MKSVELMIHARWIIPVDADNRLLEHHTAVVDGGRILDCLPQDQALSRYKASQQIRLNDHVLIPGLVNAHGHAAMSLFRGIADDLPLQTWLESHIWPLEGQWISEDFVYQGTQLAIAEMLRGGTTCFADMYFFPESSAQAASDAGIRVQLATPIIDFPTPWANTTDEAIHKTTTLHDNWRNSTLVSVAFGPHAPYTVSDEPIKRIITLAEELDVPIHMHIHETQQEVDDAIAATGMRPIERLDKLGLLSPRLLCVHGTALNDDDIERLQQSGSSVVHCPESNLKLASGFCPVHTLQQQGINVALGTDGAASNNDLDMFGELSTAAMLAKAVAKDAAALPATEALRMATINGARAMGMDQEIGSLEAGKLADIVAVRMDELNSLPLYNPVSQLVYSTRSDQVSHVWVGGRQLINDGKFTSLNISKITDQTKNWQSRLGNTP
ncbi:N-ethylammeline chlorohydrolase [Pseudohongiella nitratireducens]|uniref:5-methylthioadenosine/S-adenosylhomocysteine deaminase n=1 Tax=Pseudohongiella nitratireducens TaxID=1768907 RepID=A0A917GK25_9GAMM|nr:N-ethylammeline chlorohydrolase [Pseudohongiella nitratireducens]